MAKLCHHNTNTTYIYYAIYKKKQPTVLLLNPFRPFDSFTVNCDINLLAPELFFQF